jgi:hypothetical protein
LTEYYQTEIVLNPGLVYKFKVTARNSVGSSLYSEEIEILAAKEPNAPLNLLEIPGLTTAYQIGISWVDGVYDGATSVIDYDVSFKLSTDSAYTIYSSGVLEKTEIITGLQPGSAYDF